MVPNSIWNASDHTETINTLSKLDDTFKFKIWCDDGCKDCRAQMPDFAAALSAANIHSSCVEQYSVERLPTGKKKGPLVGEYGVTRIPTIIIERESKQNPIRAPDEIARYVELEDIPAADYLSGILANYLSKTRL